MNAKLTKVVAMASLAAFLSVGIGANVAQAKDYRYKVDANPYMVQKDQLMHIFLCSLSIYIMLNDLKY